MREDEYSVNLYAENGLYALHGPLRGNPERVQGSGFSSVGRRLRRGGPLRMAFLNPEPRTLNPPN